MDLSPLKRLGLTDGEIAVYTALLGTGRAPISALAAKTGLHRTGLYDVLEGLVGKGLVSYAHEEKKRHFSAAKPARIMEYLDERQEALAQEEGLLKELVGELGRITPIKKELLNVSIYRGAKGVKSVLEAVFTTCSEGDEVVVYGFGATRFNQLLGNYYHHYITRTIKAGLRFKGLFNEEEATEPYVTELLPLPLTDVKFTLKHYEAVTHTRVYGDKVAIMLLEKEPTAILIEDAEVAKGYRYFFDYLWERS